MNSTVKMGPGPTVPTQRPFHSYSSFFLAHIVIDFVISTPAVLSNAILLITIFRDSRRQKQLCKSSFTLLVMNLSLCDFISGAVPGCGSLYYDYMIFHTRTDEKLVGIRVMIITTGIITNVVGSCTVMAMSFDRLFAMESPLRYKTQVNVAKKKTKIFIIAVWIYALLFVGLPYRNFSGNFNFAILSSSPIPSVNHSRCGFLGIVSRSPLAHKSSENFVSYR